MNNRGYYLFYGKRFCSLVLALFLSSTGAIGAAGVDYSPYFPERGSAAIFQRSLDLRNPIVILSISLEPGFEDLPALAYLRLGRGARIISLYVTNGEATPSDVSGEPPFRLAARLSKTERAVRSHVRTSRAPLGEMCHNL